jgi:hypothetical protein
MEMENLAWIYRNNMIYDSTNRASYSERGNFTSRFAGLRVISEKRWARRSRMEKNLVVDVDSNMSFDQINKHIDANTQAYVKKLAETVAIASVSGDASYRPKVFEMAQWLLAELSRLSVQTTTRDPGSQILEGNTLALPPVILGRYGSDPAKKTGRS